LVIEVNRGRLGTGVGLTDALRVAEAHGGYVEIESNPAFRSIFDEKDKNYYNQPFLTSATMILPQAEKMQFQQLGDKHT
jgi:signal transduction histidine kinase